MGMFDWIILEEGLDFPIPEEMSGVFDKIQYQTKSLDNTMSSYLIGKDKFLYIMGDSSAFGRATTPTHKSSNNPLDSFLNLKRLNFHGVIEFYSYYQTDLIDYSIDYEAKFSDGVLEYIKLIKHEKTEHSSRKEKFERLKKQREIEENSFNKKVQRAIKRITDPIFNFFGLNNKNLQLHHPRILLGYKNNNLYNNLYSEYYSKNYGLFIEDLSIGVQFNKTKFSDVLTIKFLGFGFTYRKINYEIWNKSTIN